MGGRKRVVEGPLSSRTTRRVLLTALDDITWEHCGPTNAPRQSPTHKRRQRIQVVFGLILQVGPDRTLEKLVCTAFLGDEVQSVLGRYGGTAAAVATVARIVGMS